jgi:glycosyltransferase involved in cell wall biosynthesis
VLDNPKEADEWGQKARKLVEEEYSWEGVAERTHELYSDIV